MVWTSILLSVTEANTLLGLFLSSTRILALQPHTDIWSLLPLSLLSLHKPPFNSTASLFSLDSKMEFYNPVSPQTLSSLSILSSATFQQNSDPKLINHPFSLLLTRETPGTAGEKYTFPHVGSTADLGSLMSSVSLTLPRNPVHSPGACISHCGGAEPDVHRSQLQSGLAHSAAWTEFLPSMTAPSLCRVCIK